MNYPEIRAIETPFRGRLFRSRLEARWAIFFDCLGVEWEYESQGFESGGGRYLPDFKLPCLEVWCEVKGEPEGLRADFSRLTQVLRPGGPLPLLLLGNFPSTTSGVFFHPLLAMSDGEGLCRHWATWLPFKTGRCRLSTTAGTDPHLAVGLGLAHDRYVDRSADDAGWRVETRCLTRGDGRVPGSVLAAYGVARNARFEHGASGESAVDEFRRRAR